MKNIILVVGAALCALHSSAIVGYKLEQDTVWLNEIRYQINVETRPDNTISRYAIVLPANDKDAKSPYGSYNGVVEVAPSVNVDNTIYSTIAIGENAFRGCKGLRSVILPETIAHIFDYAFAECADLKVEIPASVRSIRAHAFDRTSFIENPDLTNIEYFYPFALSGYQTHNITIGAGNKYFNINAFKGSEKITDIYFIEDCDEAKIEAQSHSFSDFGIKDLRLPKKNLNLASEFCYNCQQLERIVFPEIDNIKYLDDFQTGYDIEGRYTESTNLIAKCLNIKEVVALGSVPPKFYRWSQTNIVTPSVIDDHSQCVLKVPQGSEELYRADPVWGRFERIEGFAPGEYTGINEAPVAEVESEVTPVYYNLQGMQVKEPVKGQLYIRCTGAKTAKIVY